MQKGLTASYSERSREFTAGGKHAEGSSAASLPLLRAGHAWAVSASSLGLAAPAIRRPLGDLFPSATVFSFTGGS